MLTFVDEAIGAPVILKVEEFVILIVEVVERVYGLKRVP